MKVLLLSVVFKFCEVLPQESMRRHQQLMPWKLRKHLKITTQRFRSILIIEFLIKNGYQHEECTFMQSIEFLIGQNYPKWSQQWAKWGEMEPKVRPMGTKRVPKWCQNGPWSCKMEPWQKCLFFGRFWFHIGKPFGSQNLQVSDKIDPKWWKMRSSQGSGENTKFVKKLCTKTRGLDL